MGELINVGSLIGKEILDLTEGVIVGRVCGVAMQPDLKVAGLKVREKRFMGNTIVVPFEHIRAFGATITVDGADGVENAETRNVIGKNVITADGTLLGKVEEMAFDSKTGAVGEIVLKGDLMDTMLDGCGILPGEKLLRIGKDAVIAAEGVSAKDLHIPTEEFYGDWKEMDDVLDEIDQKAPAGEAAADAAEKVSFQEEDPAAEESPTEKMERTLDSFTHSMEDAFHKIKEEVTSEHFKEQADHFVDRFSEEAKGLFSDMRTWISSIDTDSIKQRINRPEPEDVLATDLVAQLENLTVERPLLDEDGNVIVWPGQIIGKAEIKSALRSGNLQELLELATVPLMRGTPDTAAAAEEAVAAEKAAAEAEAAAEEAAAETGAVEDEAGTEEPLEAAEAETGTEETAAETEAAAEETVETAEDEAGTEEAADKEIAAEPEAAAEDAGEAEKPLA